ncbi:helix-turn-helix domain-containing protein [Planococcus maritimus]|uniref:helix-turn-helix domain-containing protein n=1 Tax=Planococcus maritimus TaxID=192421 RepID=UPI00079422CA|nr:helix-turn-helix transcriptional regulator [Planococcus maritimus]KYG58816.1 hypothetical protein AY633_00815 [Planococcus maritimus]
MSIGKKIAELRLNNKPRLTQEELALKIGISRASLSHYEKDRREPDYQTLQKLGDYFNISIDQILGREDKKIHYMTDRENYKMYSVTPEIYNFYREFDSSSEEEKKALLAVWEILKTNR